MAKTNKTKQEDTKKVTSNKKSNIKSNIMGICLLFGVLSIGYSSTYIIMGTDGWVPLVLVAPQIVLGGIIAAYKFCK